MILNLSPWLQKKRFEQAIPFIGEKILDVGCNEGGIIVFLKEPFDYLGVDLHLPNEKLQKFSRNQTVRFLKITCPENIPDEKFDTILLLAVLEHVKNPETLFKHYVQFLKKGGLIIVTTPSSLGDTLHHLATKVGLVNFHAVHSPHLKILNLKELRHLAVENLLMIEACKTFFYGLNLLAVYKKI